MDDDTRHILRSDLMDELTTGEFGPLPDETLPREDGLTARAVALAEWELNVVEPPGQVTTHRILDYIREGAGWHWKKDYQNRKFAWCGCFAAWAWKDSVSAAVRGSSFASTYRLQRWARGTSRVIGELRAAKPGDIVIVGSRKSWGDHITILDELEVGLEGVRTIEGNAKGKLPGGSSAEGVIRRRRSAREIRFIYRPLASD